MRSCHKISAENTGQVCACLAVLFLCLFVQRDALCQVLSEPTEFNVTQLISDAKQKVVDLRTALEKGDTAGAEPIKRDLQALLPAIQKVLSQCNESEKREFIWILRSIAGSEATQTLVKLACDRSNAVIASRALNALEDRSIDFALTDDQVECLLVQVREGGVLNAGAAARLLSRCQKNDKGQITEVILGRFCQELANPTELAPIGEAYVSPRVYVLNQFLLAFAHLGNEGIEDTKTAAEDTRKWLALARGMCGDPSVAEEIEILIKNDPDVSFRTVAVRAYARSAGEKAVPLLQSLLTDKTESEYDRLPDGTPGYPIRFTARGELVRLGHPPQNQ